jgi:hypothetical protein
MIKVTDLKNGTIEIKVMLPVVDRPMDNHFSGHGVTPQELTGYGFTVTITYQSYAAFVQDVLDGFQQFHRDRAEEAVCRDPHFIENMAVDKIVANEDGETATMTLRADLKCENPRSFGILEGISAPEENSVETGSEPS